jgi:hypothetical protein
MITTASSVVRSVLTASYNARIDQTKFRSRLGSTHKGLPRFNACNGNTVLPIQIIFRHRYPSQIGHIVIRLISVNMVNCWQVPRISKEALRYQSVYGKCLGFAVSA